MQPLVIVPARLGSVGIPHKNFRALAGTSPLLRAVRCAWDAGLEHVVVSTDHPTFLGIIQEPGKPCANRLYAPAPLHTDGCAMIDVIRDVLSRVPGEPEQPVLLVQCTQPLREPKHLTQALALLTPGVNSVVSVVETLSPQEILQIDINGRLRRSCGRYRLNHLPTRRQRMEPGFKRDGTVYAFWRKSVLKHGFYGVISMPLIIPAAETCALDLPEDWAEAERRLRERSSQA